MNATNLKLTQGLYTVHTDLVNAFLKDIAKYPILSPEEQSVLAYEAKNGNIESRNKLINCNLRFIYAIAKRYNAGDKTLDLVNIGVIGMDKAIEHYDESRGFAFLSYAVWFIRREINTELINNGALIRKTNKAKTNFFVTKARDKFFAENGRFPSEEEIIEIFNKEFDIQINDPQDLFDVEVVSIDSSFDGDDDSTYEESADYNEKTASINDYAETMENDEKAHIINSALSALKERDREIVKMAYGIGYLKAYTNQEIAAELGFTSERIRQIKKEAQAKMKLAVKQMA